MASQTPYIGSKISLISRLDIRYEGILYTVDTNDSTIALSKVKSFGTEDRPTANPVAARDEVYEYIIFKASDIKDLIVCETPKPQNLGIYSDPAIVSVSNAPVPAPESQPQSEGAAKVLDAASKAPGAGRRPPQQQQQQQQPQQQQSQGGFQQQVHRQPPLGGTQQGGQQGYRGGHQQGGFVNRGRGQGSFQRGGRPGAPQAPREKLRFDTDYDFEKANDEFLEGINKLTLEDPKKEEEPEKLDSESGDGDAEPFYDKKTSFFDRISCESLEKQEGRRNRTDWKKERETNQETFGHSAVRSLAYRRGGRGGYGFPGRGRGGYAYNGNQSGQSGNYQNGVNNYAQRGGGGYGRGGQQRRYNNSQQQQQQQ